MNSRNGQYTIENLSELKSDAIRWKGTHIKVPDILLNRILKDNSNNITLSLDKIIVTCVVMKSTT